MTTTMKTTTPTQTISDCPTIADIHASYTDDLTLLESDSDVDTLSWKLQTYVDAVAEWVACKKLT
jgi:hypothetical protein